DLQRECELGDVDVAIHITLAPLNVTGEVIVFLHFNWSAAQLFNCISEQILMFFVIRAVLQAKLEHGFADLGSAQFACCEAISPIVPILKGEGYVQNLNVIELVCIRHALEFRHCVISPSCIEIQIGRLYAAVRGLWTCLSRKFSM